MGSPKRSKKNKGKYARYLAENRLAKNKERKKLKRLKKEEYFKKRREALKG